MEKESETAREDAATAGSSDALMTLSAAPLALSEAEGVPLRAFLGAVQLLGGFLRPEERALSQLLSVQGRWYMHTPLLAEAGAAMLAQEPGLFAGLDFSDADLLADKERLGDLVAARGAVHLLGEQLERGIALYKDRLARRTGQLRDAVAAKQADPALPQPVRQRLQVASAPLRAIQDQRRQAKRAALQKTLERKALLQGTSKEQR